MRLNSGDTAPKTANYKVIDSNGKVIGKVHMQEGQPLPPTQLAGCHNAGEPAKTIKSAGRAEFLAARPA